MQPISGRISDELFEWFSETSFEGAVTQSDKLRECVATMKRLTDGDTSFLDALAMHRSLTKLTRDYLAKLDQNGSHSEVMTILAEHIPTIAASLQAVPGTTLAAGREHEALLVRRVFQLAEVLLRQAITAEASAFDPQVIQKNAGRLRELAALVAPPVDQPA